MRRISPLQGVPRPCFRLGRGDLSDAERELIGPLLPPERGRWVRPVGDNRRFFNGMLHALRIGCSWRDMHERYGKWNSIYVRFRGWAEQGVWDALLQTLIDLGLYDGNRFRESLLIRRNPADHPAHSNRKAPEHPDYRRYKDRNRSERMFSKLKQQPRIATRYDKTVLSFESFLKPAAARIWLKSFANTG